MLPRIVVYAAAFVAVLGFVMLYFNLAGKPAEGAFWVLRGLHLLAGFGIIGLYEAAAARLKRAGQVPANGKLLINAMRGLVTLALVIGFALLGSVIFGWFTGEGFSVVMWIHAVVALLGLGLVAYFFNSVKVAQV